MPNGSFFAGRHLVERCCSRHLGTPFPHSRATEKVAGQTRFGWMGNVSEGGTKYLTLDCSLRTRRRLLDWSYLFSCRIMEVWVSCRLFPTLQVVGGGSSLITSF